MLVVSKMAGIPPSLTTFAILGSLREFRAKALTYRAQDYQKSAPRSE
jgi:hypothetical protein